MKVLSGSFLVALPVILGTRMDIFIMHVNLLKVKRTKLKLTFLLEVLNKQ